MLNGDVKNNFAGAIVMKYEKLGDYVRWHVNPEPTIYEEWFKLLKISDSSRILQIGDSISTDTTGAYSATNDVLLVTSKLYSIAIRSNSELPEGNLITNSPQASNLQIIGIIHGFVW